MRGSEQYTVFISIDNHPSIPGIVELESIMVCCFAGVTPVGSNKPHAMFLRACFSNVEASRGEVKLPDVYTDFDPARLRCLDLNKLVVFVAVHRSSSVSDAATMLSVTQPAISNTLRHLRDFFGDELFVRRGKRLQATPRADAIAGYLERSLNLIEELFGRFSIQPR